MIQRIRYQTGELLEVSQEMKAGRIPCMDVDDQREFAWVIQELETYGLYLVEGLPLDRTARDTLKEPDFEFRAPFSTSRQTTGQAVQSELLYIDFYFEPLPEETYDSCFGD